MTHRGWCDFVSVVEYVREHPSIRNMDDIRIDGIPRKVVRYIMSQLMNEAILYRSIQGEYRIR